MLDVTMIIPRRSIRLPRAAFVQLKAPKKFTAMTRSKVSRVVSAKASRAVIPALLTRISTPPNLSITTEMAARQSSALVTSQPSAIQS